ncbi:glycosyltransferase family 28 domain protein [Neorickettsia helminthoeca str. Oregon]|uniref:UDP-N-acetylglucosamine--N-acetylmuramyl-(pentapeptide) pyrophosphoryl-undecaprenol N-acetylglucosamine transferase n=1 Tax=Neorickettsia helminthoeca str. Oregon TaxID=1286528 RepID=X5H3E1_9RICK|nr:UDP-N-acetylglucosamine--N-acetylmuramyl-(pentapeptide) pyrophosphoryl-undecaprenol N-acetylglucosamine transferase [Neorickettsia helminthoeca]AHX11061.1 glycosyltransferase family 28 domain protein [Neorickettsia helminthoeca str. Oregon]
MTTKYRYFIAAGGTGGHIFPALAVAEALGNEGLFITDKRSRNYGNRNIIAPCSVLPIVSSARKFKFLISFLPSVLKTLKLIIIHRPEGILSFGGYPCLPVLTAALLTRRRIFLHESNTVPGRVNRIFMRFAKKIMIGLPLKDKISRTVETGNPLTRDVIPKPYPKNSKRCILVIGGSQGSSVLGLAVARILAKFAEKTNLEITHQCKEADVIALRNFYIENKLTAEVSHFFNNIPEKIEHADLVISRSGAISISEILTIGRPGIFIPYPEAKDNHQFFNAKFVDDNHMGILLEEKNFTQESLIAAMEKVFTGLPFYLEKLTLFSHQQATQKVLDILKS